MSEEAVATLPETLPPGRPRHWDIDGLRLEGLEWGQRGQLPVLALHGWLDNAASFQRLGPRLRCCHVVAPDLSGHGRSSFRSADATYQIWDDMPQLVALLDALGWERCVLLGHSRGAVIAALLAAALPERVSHLVLLDGVIPRPVPETDFVSQLGDFLRQRSTALNRPARRYPRREQAVAVRVRNDLSEAAARALAERGLEGSDEAGWAWRIDPRLRAASAVKMSESQVRAMLSSIASPVLLLVASDGIMQRHPLEETVRPHLRRLQVIPVDGGHHFHMEANIDEHITSLLEFLAQA
ncbi:MAG: alpha/beta fold hydrolase [Parahaliea sp.]